MILIDPPFSAKWQNIIPINKIERRRVFFSPGAILVFIQKRLSNMSVESTYDLETVEAKLAMRKFKTMLRGMKVGDSLASDPFPLAGTSARLVATVVKKHDAKQFSMKNSSD